VRTHDMLSNKACVRAPRIGTVSFATNHSSLYSKLGVYVYEYPAGF
jgi:hypothetical protein